MNDLPSPAPPPSIEKPLPPAALPAFFARYLLLWAFLTLGRFLWLVSHASWRILVPHWVETHAGIAAQKAAAGLRFFLVAFLVSAGIGCLVHAGARLLGSRRPAMPFLARYLALSAFFLFLGDVRPGPGASAWILLFAKSLAFLALVARAYSFSLGQSIGAWILAGTMAGAVLVPYTLSKAAWRLLHRTSASPAVAAPARSLPAPPDPAAQALRDEATALMHAGRYKDAQKTLDRAFALQRRGGRHDMDFAATIYGLGNAHYHQRHWAVAEAYYRQALLLAQQLLKEDDPELANYYNALGCAFYSEGRAMEAEVLHEKAIELAEKDKAHPEQLALFLSNAAKDLRKLDRAKDAERLERKAKKLTR